MNTAKMIRAGENLKALWELGNVLEHDIACWKEVRDKAQGFDAVIYAMAHGRVESLKLEVDLVYEAVLDMQKEQQREAMKEPLEHKLDNRDYTKRQHRKGHGWKKLHES